MRAWTLLLVIVVSIAGCSPPCSSSQAVPEELCFSASPQPGLSFTLTATSYFGSGGGGLADCVVTVDGGVISLSVTATGCAGDQTLPVARAATTTCELPPLPAGSYSVSSRMLPSTLTVPAAQGDTIRVCR